MKIASIFSRIKRAFKGKTDKPEMITEAISTAAPKIKKPGRGAYFNNNRRRTKGRNVQYVIMPSAHPRLSRPETI
jgi:hypothetical protein